MGPGKDTNGTPVPEQGRPWVARHNFHETSNDNTTDKVLTQTCFQETSVDSHLETYEAFEWFSKSSFIRSILIC